MHRGSRARVIKSTINPKSIPAVLVLTETFCYDCTVLNCTWDDNEAEIVIRNLELPLEEQKRLQSYYLKLREEYRNARQADKKAE